MEVDAGTAVAAALAVIAFIEVRVKIAVERAVRPVPKRASDWADTDPTDP